MPEEERPGGARNIVESFFNTVYNVLDKPTVWFRESVVERNQKSYPWYHQKFRRVPSIQECYVEDPVCFFEADNQYKRDRLVDTNILNILRQRFEECTIYEAPDHLERCRHLLDQVEEASTNWFIKYGDLGAYHDVRRAYMKQKHRLIWERRHGPVGSGKKGDSIQAEDNHC